MAIPSLRQQASPGPVFDPLGEVWADVVAAPRFSQCRVSRRPEQLFTFYDQHHPQLFHQLDLDPFRNLQ